MAWGPIPIFFLGMAVVHLAVGGLLLTSRRPANILLATLLIVQAVGPAGFLQALRWAEVEGWTSTLVTIRAILASIPFVYALFIGLTIPHRATAWLRKQWVRIAIFLLWAAAIVGVVQPTVAAPVFIVIMAFTLGISLFALIASFLYWRSAAGASRTRAAWYLTAFALRDVATLILASSTILESRGYDGIWPFILGRIFMGISDVVLGIGLLRGQLLAFNHQLLRAGAGAIAVAVLVGGFVALTELAEAVLSSGNNAIGIGVAVVMALTFRPLQSFVKGRLRQRFPHVKSLHDMGTAERVAAYREQWELAWEDGTITPKEQQMLDRTAHRLGLSLADTRAVAK